MTNVATDIFKTLFKIATFSAGPQDMPYSRFLLYIFAAIEIFLGVITSHFVIYVVSSKQGTESSLASFTTTEFLLVGLIKVFILFAFLYGLLGYFDKTARFIQASSTMLGINIILAFFFMVAVALLQFSGLAFILFFILLYWNFMLITNIFLNSFDTEIIKAGLLALLYLLLQHSVSDIIFQYLAK